MFFKTPSRVKIAAMAVALMAGSSALMAAQPAEASDAFAAGVVGGLIGSMIVPPAYPAPVYVAPQPVYVEPAPVVVYEGPAYAEPVYVDPPYTARPAYLGPSSVRPAYPQRRALSETAAPRYGGDGPRVVTYDDTVGGQRIAGAEPWSPGWYDYCRAKFRSFDDESGTFLGYDGQRHFCVVK